MIIRAMTAAAIGAAMMVGGSAFADPGTVNTSLAAAYDTTFGGTSFTLYNNGALTDTNLTLWTTAQGTPTSELLDDLGAGLSATYAFNENMGGFVTDPAAAQLPDDTQYYFTFDYDGIHFTSALFSPSANLSGGYVDFLGNCYAGNTTSCTLNESGVVAAVAAVPEPSSLALLGLPLTLLAFRLRRRA